MGAISIYVAANADPQEINNVLECVAKKAGIEKPPLQGREVHVPSDDDDAFQSALHSCDPAAPDRPLVTRLTGREARATRRTRRESEQAQRLPP